MMMESKETKMPENIQQTTQQTQARPNETGGFHFEGHIKIFDPETKEVFIDKRNAIHYENMSVAMVNALSNQGFGTIYEMSFGSGGTIVDPTGLISYLTPNTIGVNSSLYNQTYTKVVDQTFEGAVNRLTTIAKNNVVFDETMGATSWINADGERVWGHQSPTYNHKKTRALRELSDSTKLGDALEDVFAANNYLLSTEAFQSILPGINLDRVDGMRLEALFNANGVTFSSNRIVDRGSDGTTAGRLSDVQYLVTNLALYLSGEKIQYRRANGTSATTVTATINPGVIESSNTIDLVSLPVIKAVETRNKQQVITNDVINAIKSMVKGEYERIRQVQKEINDPEIIKKDGYHTSYKGNAPRGLQFIRTASILGTSLKEQLD
jgi:hypothetical protein